MWWINSQTKTAKHRGWGSSDEGGAVLVMVALSMVMLFGFLAIVVDFGRVYTERRELQNGADAAALAVARDCAFGDCGTSAERTNTAEQYADANASDDLAWVQSVTVDLGAQTVRVETGTEDPGGDHHFDMVFAQLVGYDGLTVDADATVAWGAPKGLATLPLIFSTCEWEKFGSTTHPPEAVINGELPPTLGYPRQSEYATVFFHGRSEPCHESPSGQDLPGGFGWLDSSGDCSADIDAGGWVSIDPGNSPTTGCSASDLSGLIGEVVLIPYFDDIVGTGAGAQYHVAGFGALYVTGYNFTGRYKENSVIPDHTKACSPPDTCIEGYFIKPWAASGGGEIGGGDFGVRIIQFVD
ncbi:MAG: pilus assembly protein TadG-related protein [Actinomycetia bacterium]|nr:pilus assembly protein TadG-related protein [Actinomycetes bacterium]